MDHGARRLRLVGLAVALAAASAAFALVATNISEGQPLALLDARAANWLHTRASPTLTHVLLVITHMHAPIAFWIYSAGIGYLLARRAEWTWVIALALAAPVGLALNGLIKQVFQRSRPSLNEPLLVLSSYSFPSGHTAGAVLFYGVLAAYAVRRASRWHLRTACVLLWLGLVTLVGFSRMYLGVHYLSDILGAAAWAFAWLAFALWAAPHARRAFLRPGGR